MTKEEAIKVLADDFFTSTPYEFLTKATNYIRQIDEPRWHTGTPTEEGWYLVALKLSNKISYDTVLYSNGTFDFAFSSVDLKDDVIAWQKIEPFKEQG